MQQVPCRGFAAPSDQSPRHKSAKAWPGRNTAVKGSIWGENTLVRRACRVLVQPEEKSARDEMEGCLVYIANGESVAVGRDVSR
jgi:hypothetical protein